MDRRDRKTSPKPCKSTLRALLAAVALLPALAGGSSVSLQVGARIINRCHAEPAGISARVACARPQAKLILGASRPRATRYELGNTPEGMTLVSILL